MSFYGSSLHRYMLIMIMKLGQRDASFQKKRGTTMQSSKTRIKIKLVISRVNHANALVVLLKSIILSINYKKYFTFKQVEFWSRPIQLEESASHGKKARIPAEQRLSAFNVSRSRFLYLARARRTQPSWMRSAIVRSASSDRP
jgi:hypothetical protein